MPHSCTKGEIDFARQRNQDYFASVCALLECSSALASETIAKKLRGVHEQTLIESISAITDEEFFQLTVAEIASLPIAVQQHVAASVPYFNNPRELSGLTKLKNATRIKDAMDRCKKKARRASKSAGSSGAPREPSRWLQFMVANRARIAGEHPGAANAEVMQLLGAEYRAQTLSVEPARAQPLLTGAIKAEAARVAPPPALPACADEAGAAQLPPLRTGAGKAEAARATQHPPLTASTGKAGAASAAQPPNPAASVIKAEPASAPQPPGPSRSRGSIDAPRASTLELASPAQAASSETGDGFLRPRFVRLAVAYAATHRLTPFPPALNVRARACVCVPRQSAEKRPFAPCSRTCPASRASWRSLC